jgi:hypothetical protein
MNYKSPQTELSPCLKPTEKPREQCKSMDEKEEETLGLLDINDELYD